MDGRIEMIQNLNQIEGVWRLSEAYELYNYI